MHLEWALELYRIGEVDDAEKHSVIAESHASQIGPHATASTTYWSDLAGLYAGCARADGDDPAGAAAQIRRYADRIRACERMDVWVFGMPFLAVALDRSGHRAEALAVVEEALPHLPEHGTWLVAAALTHTHAVLLARSGSPAVRAALRYGDELATALWRQRQRTRPRPDAVRGTDADADSGDVGRFLGAERRRLASRRPAHSVQRRTGQAVGAPQRSHRGGPSRGNPARQRAQIGSPGASQPTQR